MTYKLDSFVGKIKSPVICVIGGVSTEYPDGQALLDQTFDKYYLVSSISNFENGIIVELQENKRINETNWTGEEQSFF